MVYSPIYRNTYYTTSADSLTYRITLDGEEIFAGRAVKYPDADEMKINVDRICSSRLSSDIADILDAAPSVSTEYPDWTVQRTFQLWDGEGSLLEEYMFYDDWSYSPEKPVTGTVITSSPVNGHYFPGMMMFRSRRETGENGSAYTVASLDTESPLEGYDRQVKCCRYALYYLNSFGGWDSFAVEGNTAERDAYTPYTIDRSYDNTTFEFEYEKYIQEIKKTYALNTGLLSDDDSRNLAKNLLGSTRVYLHNVEEGWIEPVVITDNTVDYQTYATNGKKAAQYRINVQLSHSRLRK